MGGNASGPEPSEAEQSSKSHASRAGGSAGRCMLCRSSSRTQPNPEIKSPMQQQPAGSGSNQKAEQSTGWEEMQAKQSHRKQSSRDGMDARTARRRHRGEEDPPPWGCWWSGSPQVLRRRGRGRGWGRPRTTRRCRRPWRRGEATSVAAPAFF